MLDFSQFFGWIKDNIKHKRILDKVELVNSQIEQLKIETVANLQSWKNNPDKIKIPIRLKT